MKYIFDKKTPVKFSLQKLLYGWRDLSDFSMSQLRIEEGSYVYYVNGVLKSIKYVGLYRGPIELPTKDCIPIKEDGLYISDEENSYTLTKKFWCFSEQKAVDVDNNRPFVSKEKSASFKKWFIFKRNHFKLDLLPYAHAYQREFIYDLKAGGTILIKIIKVYAC